METSNIQKSIKKYFYSGVSFAAHSSDIIKNAVDEFVSQGKLSEKDGQKIVGAAIGKLEARYNEAAEKVGNYAVAEIAMLRKKIEGLEKKLSGKGPIAAKAVKAVKKAASKPVVKKAVARAEKAVTRKATKTAGKKSAAKKVAARRPAKKAASKRA